MIILGKNKLDYKYNFDQAAVESVPVNLSDNVFAWPDVKDFDTVLLKLKVAEKFWRKFLMPWLEVETDSGVSRQFLERHNSGARYLNLTNLATQLAPGAKIKLLSNRLKWQADAELLTFNNRIPTDAKVLVIAAHPDDAEIGAFGFYSSHNSHIITITAGEAGNALDCDRFTKAKLRVLDSIMVPIMGGVAPENSINLGYFDETLEEMYRDPKTPVASHFTEVSDTNLFRQFNLSPRLPACSGKASWCDLVADLAALITEIQPEVIVLPNPLLDKHLDHKFSFVAVSEALEQTEIDAGNFLFYLIHPEQLHKYPYGPQSSIVTIPPNFKDCDIAWSVYSHALTEQQQLDKNFALDAMHDLRYEPDHICTIGDAIRQQLDRLLRRQRHINPWHDFFRKAVRPNELFLALPFSKKNELVKAWMLK